MRRSLVRKVIGIVLTAVLSLAQPGCVIVVGVRDIDDKELVEIDGEIYVKDKSAHRLEKLEITKPSPSTESETTTTTTVEPSKGGG
jgi:hypothetical protein